MADEFTPEDLELLDEIAVTLKDMLRRLETRACPYQWEEMAAKVEPVGNTASAREKNLGVEVDQLVPCQSATEAHLPTVEVVEQNANHGTAYLDQVEPLTKEIVEAIEYPYYHRFDVDVEARLLKPLVADILPTTGFLDQNSVTMKEQIS